MGIFLFIMSEFFMKKLLLSFLFLSSVQADAYSLYPQNLAWDSIKNIHSSIKENVLTQLVSSFVIIKFLVKNSISLVANYQIDRLYFRALDEQREVFSDEPEEIKFWLRGESPLLSKKSFQYCLKLKYEYLDKYLYRKDLVVFNSGMQFCEISCKRSNNISYIEGYQTAFSYNSFAGSAVLGTKYVVLIPRWETVQLNALLEKDERTEDEQRDLDGITFFILRELYRIKSFCTSSVSHVIDQDFSTTYALATVPGIALHMYLDAHNKSSSFLSSLKRNFSTFAVTGASYLLFDYIAGAYKERECDLYATNNLKILKAGAYRLQEYQALDKDQASEKLHSLDCSEKFFTTHQLPGLNFKASSASSYYSKKIRINRLLSRVKKLELEPEDFPPLRDYMDML
jgi:hypothetical protein